MILFAGLRQMAFFIPSGRGFFASRSGQKSRFLAVGRGNDVVIENEGIVVRVLVLQVTRHDFFPENARITRVRQLFRNIIARPDRCNAGWRTADHCRVAVVVRGTGFAEAFPAVDRIAVASSGITVHDIFEKFVHNRCGLGRNHPFPVVFAVAVIDDDFSVVILNVEIIVRLIVDAAVAKNLIAGSELLHRNSSGHAAERHRRERIRIFLRIQMRESEFFRQESIRRHRRQLRADPRRRNVERNLQRIGNRFFF